MKKKLALLTVLLLIALVLVLPTPVGATLQVSVTVYDTEDTSIGNSQVIVDGGPGDTDGIVNNQISLGNNFEPLPGLIVQGSFHTSKLGGQNLITSGSSTVTNGRSTRTRAVVAVSDTDFTPPVSSAELTGSGTFTNAAGSEIHLRYYDDPANVQGADHSFANYDDFVVNVALLTPGDLVGEYNFEVPDNSESFLYNPPDIAVYDTEPFSMTLYFDFELTPGGLLISRGQSMMKPIVPSIPEFPTMAFPAAFIVGLIGAVFYIKRTKEN